MTSWTWFKHRGYIIEKKQSKVHSKIKAWFIEGVNEELYMPIHAIEYINEVIFGEEKEEY